MFFFRRLGLVFNDLSILSDLFKLSYGSVIGPLIYLAAQPILKNIYDPEIFGILELFTKLVAICATLYSLRYDVCVVNTKTISESKDIVIVSIFFGTILFFCSIIVLYISRYHIIDCFNLHSNYDHLIYFIPISAYFFMLGKLFQSLLLRLNKFNPISLSRVIRRLFETSSQYYLFNFFNYFSLFIGEVIGNISSLIFSLFITKNISLFSERKPFLSYVKIISRNKRTQLFLLPSDLLNVLTESFFIIVFVKNFGIKSTGFLELSLKILLIPVALISSSIGSLIFQTVSKSIQKQNLFNRKIIILCVLATLFGLFFALIITYLGEYLVILFFGEKWLISLEYCKILIYPVCFQLIISPLGQILLALKKYHLDAFIKLLKFILLASLFFLSFNNEEEFLITYSSIICMIYFIYGFVISIEIIKYNRDIN